MQEPSPALSRRTFVGGATALAAASLAFPSTAFAVTAAEKQAEADAVRNQLVGLNADLEAAAERYYGALDEQNAARTAMEAEQVKIDEATAQIADLQDHLGTRARSMYRSGSATFLDFLMGATSFAEFTQNWDILNGLNENDSQMVAETKELRESVEASKAEYAKQEKIAADKAAEAKAIKEEVEAKIAQADALMNSLDAEARVLLEEEQRAAAEAAAAPGAVLIISTRCNDGTGGDSFYHALADCDTLEHLMERILATPMDKTDPDQWEYQILCRMMLKHRIIFVSEPAMQKTIEEMKLEYAPDLDTALDRAREAKGKDAHLVIIPNGISVIVEP